MIFQRFSVWLAVALAGVSLGRAEEHNRWPLVVSQTGTEDSWTAAGPFLFDKPTPEAGRVSGFRPFYVRWDDPGGGIHEVTVLYPLFFYREYGDMYSWSIVNLINRYRRKTPGPATPETQAHTFDIWPFYFSRETGDPATTYHALFPIGGELQDRFFYTKITFAAFPLYVRTEKRGATTTSVPWPFFRVTRGAETGVALWPLFGYKERPGEWSRHYFLWPLIWNDTTLPPAGAPKGTPPTRDVGFLPFYAARHGPNGVSENYLWPFFGYNDTVAPYRYHETRYFWPFFVQGRGDDRYRNRWGPFYTHSVVKGMDKTWAPWPLFKRMRWQDGDIAQTKTLLYFFLYSRWEQRKVSNPSAAPAVKVHYWPFVTIWDNGAGRRQWQVFSPLEVFFPDNPEVRESWSPFFALCQHDVRPPGDTRTSLLWNAVTWEKHPGAGTSEFHLGPILTVRREASGRRSWRLFAMEFSSHPSKVLASAR